MRRLIFAIGILLFFCPQVHADIEQRLIIEEEDGDPSTIPYILKVANGSLTDNLDGTASHSQAGGGSGDVTDVGNVASGAAFTGTQGTQLIFFDAGGNGTLDYDGTWMTWDKGLNLTAENKLFLGSQTEYGSGQLQYTRLMISGDDGDMSDIAIRVGGDDVAGVNLAASGGTAASPTDVANGSQLGILTFNGFVTDDYYEFARIGGLVDADVGTGDYPGALRFMTTPDGASSVIERMKIDSAGAIHIGTAGVKITQDGDGALTILGLGDGSDEDWNINFDDTSNSIVHNTSTGATLHDYNTNSMNISVQTEAYDSTGWNSDNTVPTKDAVRDKFESLSIPADVAKTSFGITIDGGGSAITTGVKGYIEIPYDCTITQATVLLDQSGSIVIDVWKDTYANYPPTDADSITASAPPTVTTATKSQDSTLTGWTTTVTEGDVIGFNVDSITTATRAHLIIKVNKT